MKMKVRESNIEPLKAQEIEDVSFPKYEIQNSFLKIGTLNLNMEAVSSEGDPAFQSVLDGCRGSVVDFVGKFFSFLARRTEFYAEGKSYNGQGFGHAEDIVRDNFRKWQFHTFQKSIQQQQQPKLVENVTTPSSTTSPSTSTSTSTLKLTTDEVDIIPTVPISTVESVPVKTKDDILVVPSAVESTPKTKPQWIKVRRNGTSNKYSGTSSGDKSKQKRMKQVKLTSMTKPQPEPVIDLSTLKEFKGGNRSIACSSSNKASNRSFPSIVKEEQVSVANVSRDLFEDEFDTPDIFHSTPTGKNETFRSRIIDRPTKRKSSEMFEPENASMSPDRTQFPGAFVDPDETAFIPPPTPSPENQLINKIISPQKIENLNLKLFMTSKQKNEQSPIKSIKPLVASPLRVNNGQSPIKQPPPPKFVSSKNNKSTKQNFNCTADAFKDFDVVPEPAADKDLPYKVVRKKADRAKLDGWACDMCRQYYESLDAEIHPSEMRRLMMRSCKHKSVRPMNLNNTPPDAWRTTMPSTEEAYRRGLIGIGVASPPVRRKRHDLLD